MKLIVAGATGFVGKEIVSQALKSPSFTSVVTIGRRALELDEPDKSDKLTDVVLEDFSHYPNQAIKQLADADAVIWTLAVTPTKAREMDPEVVRKICYDYTFTGLDAIVKARSAKQTPVRFLYVSGAVVRRDSENIPEWVPKEMMPYLLMRCQVEQDLVAYKGKQDDRLDFTAVRPGFIVKSGEKPKGPEQMVNLLGVIEVETLAAGLLHEVTAGFEKDPLDNDDLVRIGKTALGSA